MLAWDGRWENARSFPGMEQVFAANFARLGAAVPPDVELGFHLCYGDLDGKHFIEPVDASKMVEMANLIARSVEVAARRSSDTAGEVERVGEATDATRTSATAVKSVAGDLGTVATRIRAQVDQFFQKLRAA